jgi:hypothetical protein
MGGGSLIEISLIDGIVNRGATVFGNKVRRQRKEGKKDRKREGRNSGEKNIKKPGRKEGNYEKEKRKSNLRERKYDNRREREKKKNPELYQFPGTN